MSQLEDQRCLYEKGALISSCQINRFDLLLAVREWISLSWRRTRLSEAAINDMRLFRLLPFTSSQLRERKQEKGTLTPFAWTRGVETQLGMKKRERMHLSPNREMCMDSLILWLRVNPTTASRARIQRCGIGTMSHLFSGLLHLIGYLLTGNTIFIIRRDRTRNLRLYTNFRRFIWVYITTYVHKLHLRFWSWSIQKQLTTSLCEDRKY